ncbi:MAG: M20/M25/M40 family metallo-hydrolase [Kiritimatiellae bacterium]|jgi:acetylornithine deacetylase/succinyl-diaminopimelate desuccinylase-like protein|nr:M20/M25/M40 family metallo-hydrolase [Kiritimatiellia bacterium]
MNDNNNGVTMNSTSFAKSYFDKNQHFILEEWYNLLKLPTLGADTDHLGDCARATAILKKFLLSMNFAVEIITPEDEIPVPILIAERAAADAGTTVLFYGHYDVQPATPVDAWNTPPFEPTLIDGRVYARGAQDNKGQMVAFLQGIKALIDSGKPIPNIKIVMEGQEESGSFGLIKLAPDLSQRLQADVLLVCDTSCAPDGRPAIISSLRGIQNLTVTLKGPDYDLHSGTHGGVAPNPAQGIARLLASLHNENGSIAVQGFNDAIAPPSREEIEMARCSQQSDESYKAEIGCLPQGGERELPSAVRAGFYPTIEVNGLFSGHYGTGPKTVIPATASAKLSMRLVPYQKTADTLKSLQSHLTKHCPPGFTISFSEIIEGAPGFRLPVESPIFKLAEDVLKEMDERGPVFKWEGASIPVVATLQNISGAAPLLVGFGREEDKIHCPNESFSIDQFIQVMEWSTLILEALAF